MYRTSGILDPSIFFKVDFITTVMSNLYIFLCSSTIKTIYIIYLYFIKN